MDKKVYEFIEKQAGDKIIEWRTCKSSGEAFAIYQGEKELLEKISPTIGGEKFQIDLPEDCYRVRILKRLAFRNEKKFYHVTCAKTGKQEISIVSDAVKKVINMKDWHEEDFFAYGIDYSGNFFEDIQRLYTDVPYLPRLVVNSENSEYCNQALYEKNCYLCVWGQNSENCAYIIHDAYSKYAVDGYGIFQTDVAYECVHVFKCMRAFFSSYLLDCFNVRFGTDLTNCKNVLFGFGLNNMDYVFKNKVYPKEEREAIFQTYKKKIKTISWCKELLKEYGEFSNSCFHPAVRNTNAEGSVGSQINNCKHMIFSFGGEGTDDSRYCSTQWRSHDVMDVEAASSSQLIYNCIWSTKMYGSLVIVNNFGELRDSYYDFYTRGGNNLLGCFGIQNQEYCILNKKYPKDQRETLARKIVGDICAKHQWGKFLDTKNSPFPYNDTLADKFFPVKETKIGNVVTLINPRGIGQVEIVEPGKFISPAFLDLWGSEKLSILRRTQEVELNIPPDDKVMHAQDIPDDINDVDERILDKVIICEQTGRPFKLTRLEFDFYKTYELPIPTRHYEQRELDRHENIIPDRYLDTCICDKCGKETLCEHRPDRSYKVYCEVCYKKEIYG